MTPEEIDRRSQDAIRRWQASKEDRSAFTELVALHETFVLRLVARKYARPTDDQHVIEVTQESFVQLLSALDGYVPFPGVRFRSWLVRFVRSRIHDARRAARKGIGKKLSRLEPTVDVAAAEPRRDVLPADMEGLEKELEQAIAGLPAEVREVLRLKNEEGKDFRTIGKEMGIPRTTAQDHFNRASATLAEIYKRYSG